MTDEEYINIAIEISKNTKYPYGAIIIIKDNQIIGRSDNKTLMETSMYSHAELEAIESASISSETSRHLCDASAFKKDLF